MGRSKQICNPTLNEILDGKHDEVKSPVCAFANFWVLKTSCFSHWQRLVSLCFSVLADSYSFVSYLSVCISVITGCMLEGIGVHAIG